MDSRLSPFFIPTRNRFAANFDLLKLTGEVDSIQFAEPNACLAQSDITKHIGKVLHMLLLIGMQISLLREHDPVPQHLGASQEKAFHSVTTRRRQTPVTTGGVLPMFAQESPMNRCVEFLFEPRKLFPHRMPEPNQRSLPESRWYPKYVGYRRRQLCAHLRTPNPRERARSAEFYGTEGSCVLVRPVNSSNTRTFSSAHCLSVCYSC